MIAGVTVDRDRLRRTTAPHLLCERARSTPDLVAFRSKHFGIYRERSWRDYAMLVAHAARALQSLGIGRGERVAIMGDVCEEWMICDLAAQSLGADHLRHLSNCFSQRKSTIRCATVGPASVYRGRPGIRRQDPADCRSVA